VPTGDRHVTLVFLGRVAEDTARRVWAALPTMTLPHERRALAWERFGRTAIALELADDDGLLEAAADACREASTGVDEGRPPERFRPHVTMARVARRARPPSPRALARWQLPAEPLRVGALTLFRAAQQSSGDRYEQVDHRR
jgi:2'-5' RNA ligase